jgi:hypothetical protein
MVETTPTKTKSKTKTKTTIAALIVIATIIALPLVANKVAFAAGAPTPTAGANYVEIDNSQCSSSNTISERIVR